MNIVECKVPAASALERRVIEEAYFCDAYRLPLAQQQVGVVDIFFGIFGHHPVWMKLVLMARNRIALLCGLDASTASEIMKPEVKSSYRVGDKIGPWPIFALTDTELIAGRNNPHLDFRLSVLKQAGGDVPNAVVSTICTVHNRIGKIYLFFIVPFHKWGVRRLISRAIAAGRV